MYRKDGMLVGTSKDFSVDENGLYVIFEFAII